MGPKAPLKSNIIGPAGPITVSFTGAPAPSKSNKLGPSGPNNLQLKTIIMGPKAPCNCFLVTTNWALRP